MDPFSYHLTLFLPLGIVLIVAAARTARSWIAFKERQLQATSDAAAEKAAQYAAKTERLEQRVAVLERIVTERSAHLSDEIERLRDRPLN